MRILVVKLSSLGDIVHALPVVADIHAAHPGATIDWVAEPAFAPLLRRVAGLAEVIEAPLRRWSSAGWWATSTRREMRAFVRRLRRDAYDAVIDLQGLTKSAVVARLARGRSYGLANRTEGSSHESPARWLVSRAIRVEPHSHALDRSRELVAGVLGHRAETPPRFGLAVAVPNAMNVKNEPIAPGSTVVLVHGSSRSDKLWPESHWIELGRRLVDSGLHIALPSGSDEERARAMRLAAAIGEDRCAVWPPLDLAALVERMSATLGVIGVDSGPSHIAVALDLPHVQIYNVATAWRTGPQAGHGHRHQVSVEARPTPSVEAVWTAWQDVRAVRTAAS